MCIYFYSLIAILDVYQVSLTTVVSEQHFVKEKTAEEVIKATKSGSFKLYKNCIG